MSTAGERAADEAGRIVAAARLDAVAQLAGAAARIRRETDRELAETIAAAEGEAALGRASGPAPGSSASSPWLPTPRRHRRAGPGVVGAGWVAGTVRARAMARRRIGAAGARALAASSSLDVALAGLVGSPYGHDVRGGMTLAQAQHAWP
ncbi:hypothetical protein ACFFTK_13025 [Pseudonocardia petroleophila]|uniref:Uncharacterized protein n=1 Tax=Pseudonocardia petroleophila TaxID=37331 RepID=A0A7G7MJ04_9PSEU|nr:hypothetical protein [Pseudonocardia petroleophila]QNG52765.1 hypothetical protein H6H00_01495 [Pseudonocardia petroleophila]